MKKLMLILVIGAIGVLSTQCTRGFLGGKVEAVPAIQQDIPEPSGDAADLFEFPRKEDGLKGWLNWLLGAALFLVYEILVRIKPTSKTYSLLGLFYNFLNWVKADKAKNGDTFKIDAG
jgi:hypothetical protein